MEPWKKVTRGALWQQRVCGPYLFLKQSKQQKKAGLWLSPTTPAFSFAVFFAYFAKIASILLLHTCHGLFVIQTAYDDITHNVAFAVDAVLGFKVNQAYFALCQEVF